MQGSMQCTHLGNVEIHSDEGDLARKIGLGEVGNRFPVAHRDLCKLSLKACSEARDVKPKSKVQRKQSRSVKIHRLSLACHQSKLPEIPPMLQLRSPSWRQPQRTCYLVLEIKALTENGMTDWFTFHAAEA